LDKLVARYEEGMQLLKSCEEKLRSAELRIEELSSDEDSAN
jgi:exodeoxyribonuclease VII small subunit